MPEGHTLFRLAREQSTLFAGRPVHVTSPQGRFEAGAALLDGRVLDEVFSYGKHLFARFGGDHLHVHLGLYGTYVTGPGTPPPAKGALRMRWEADGPDGAGVWTDLRGPTACEVLPAPEVATILDRLGPDPLRPRADGGRAFRRISGSRTAIGALLMDQAVLAGVGNVYRAELLFRHRVSPFRPGRAVDEALWAQMWADLVTLLRSGVRMGRIARPARRTAPAGAAPYGARTPTTSTAAPACRAGSAAPRCGPRSWSAATSTGARPARPCESSRRPVRTGTVADVGTGGRAGGLRAAAVVTLTAAATVLAGQAAAGAAPTEFDVPLSPVGVDISHPQCDAELPDARAFAVVGVNGGRATEANPCLDEQLEWAWESNGSVPEQPVVQLYLNTANPGQVSDLVTTWPSEGETPYGECDGDNTAACSWRYGWERTRDSVTEFFLPAARDAGVDSLASSYRWWLDVETMNTWQSGSDEAQERNRATLEGMAAYLDFRGADVGLYSTGQQWEEIVGTVPGGSPLAGLPSWLAGSVTVAGAVAACELSPLVPRGRVSLTQYVPDDLDRNHSCG